MSNYDYIIETQADRQMREWSQKIDQEARKLCTTWQWWLAMLFRKGWVGTHIAGITVHSEDHAVTIYKWGEPKVTVYRSGQVIYE